MVAHSHLEKPRCLKLGHVVEQCRVALEFMHSSVLCAICVNILPIKTSNENVTPQYTGFSMAIVQPVAPGIPRAKAARLPASWAVKADETGMCLVTLSAARTSIVMADASRTAAHSSRLGAL